jgi:hypothetical protein
MTASQQSSFITILLIWRLVMKMRRSLILSLLLIIIFVQFILSLALIRNIQIGLSDDLTAGNGQLIQAGFSSVNRALGKLVLSIARLGVSQTCSGFLCLQSQSSLFKPFLQRTRFSR